MYKEGRASIKYSKKAFLNPKAMFLRDLSVAFVNQAASKTTNILDPTAATGIRGIRFYLETKSRRITLLDINKPAAGMAMKNVRFNKVEAKVLHTSIQEFANSTKERFDIIDLDPFGSSAPYIYDLMKIVKEGSHILVTATDTAVLCGAHDIACLETYDAKPMHNELCHEVGIRILIGFIARIATQFNYGIDVSMSLSYLHYMKLFIRFRHGAANSQESVRNLGYAYFCQGCGSRFIEASTFPKYINCKECKTRLTVSGKLWAGSLQDKRLLDGMLSYFISNGMEKGEVKLLGTMCNELDIPLYYSVPRATSRLGIPSVSPDTLIERLRARGFVAARTHFDSSGIKTNATIKDINAILLSRK